MSEFAGPNGDELQGAVDAVDDAGTAAASESADEPTDELDDLEPDSDEA